VPDQPKSIVARACRYDPEINPTYLEFARHYGTCIVPARPRRPKDKAKVEAAVLLAQRWIIGVLRDRTFYSIDEIVKAIAEPLGKLNDRNLRKLGRSRRELFLELDKPALKPLPENAYEFAEWKIDARVNLDYHVEFAKNFYSVPFQHAREKVDIRARARTIEVFLRSRRVASHPRRFGIFQYATLKEHMPRSYREHLEWTPSRIISWAGTVGPSTTQMVERIMTERPHPEQGFRACLGILRLGKRYSGARLEKACARALACCSHSYRAVESILKNGLEDKPLPTVEAPPLPFHENVRGSSYFN
jgi:transposase